MAYPSLDREAQSARRSAGIIPPSDENSGVLRAMAGADSGGSGGLSEAVCTEGLGVGNCAFVDEVVVWSWAAGAGQERKLLAQRVVFDEMR